MLEGLGIHILIPAILILTIFQGGSGPLSPTVILPSI